MLLLRLHMPNISGRSVVIKSYDVKFNFNESDDTVRPLLSEVVEAKIKCAQLLWSTVKPLLTTPLLSAVFSS